MSSSAEENVSQIYSINLGRAWLTPRYRRTDRVVNMIREFAKKHMRSKEVKLDQELNRQVWKRGRAHPPRRLRVRMTKDEYDVVVVSPYEVAVGKNNDNSATSDEQAKSKQAQDTLAETESDSEGLPEEELDTRGNKVK